MCGILKEETRERDEWNRGTVGAEERQNKGGGKSEVEGGSQHVEGGRKKAFYLRCARGGREIGGGTEVLLHQKSMQKDLRKGWCRSGM